MNHLKTLVEVLQCEAQALNKAASRVTEEAATQAVQIFELLNKTGGNLVVCGVGKSGVVAQKMASTFCSLGLSSHFLHPTEALHGDIGRLSRSDAIIFISKSGTTEEILKMAPYIPIPKSMTIGLLGNPKSPIADLCQVVFDCSVEKEACLNNLAPTTSSTLALAMGDSLAVLYEQVAGVSKEKFAFHHPGGILGKSLRLQVKDIMVSARHCPSVHHQANMQEVILAMTKFPTGLCAVLDDEENLLGVIVEGDIRRSLMHNKGLLEISVQEVMTKGPIVVSQEALAYDALRLMEERQRPISVLPVLSDKKFVGVVRLHDLLKEGFSLK